MCTNIETLFQVGGFSLSAIHTSRGGSSGALRDAVGIGRWQESVQALPEVLYYVGMQQSNLRSMCVGLEIYSALLKIVRRLTRSCLLKLLSPSIGGSKIRYYLIGEYWMMLMIEPTWEEIDGAYNYVEYVN
jgi:hypothetical protein